MSLIRQSSIFPGPPFSRPPRRVTRLIALAPVVLLVLAVSFETLAQTAPSPPASKPAAKETTKDGYLVHQTADLGGHVASVAGSGAMYATLINVHSGPRVLGETFELHALPDSQHVLVDQLFASTSGFGGDPLYVAILRMSKGKLYDFQGLFRRDRQYFDYNLLGNPAGLVPAGLVSERLYVSAIGRLSAPLQHGTAYDGYQPVHFAGQQSQRSSRILAEPR